MMISTNIVAWINVLVFVYRFEDGIVVISLLSSCVMRFKPLPGIGMGQNNDNVNYYNKFNDIQNTDKMVPVILRPGSVLALSGSARYNWTHGIEETKIDEIGDEKIIRNIRISVTLRKMKQDQLLINKNDSFFEIKKRGHWTDWTLSLYSILYDEQKDGMRA